MALFDAIAVPSLERIAKAFEELAINIGRLATVAEKLVETPAAPPLPAKPAGPEAIGEYGEALVDSESPEEMRSKLEEMGWTSQDIESFVMSRMFGGEEES